MKIISRDDARSAGLKRFFLGEKCGKGHVSERLVSNGSCVVCHAARSLAAYHKNPEATITRVIAARNEDRAKHNEKRRDYWARNKGILNEKRREFRVLNPDVVKRWDSESSKKKQYWRTPSGRSLYSSRRKKMSRVLWADRDTIKSFYEEARYFGMEIDHIVPLTHPLVCGLHVEDNLQLLSKSTNSQKGNRFDPLTFVHEVPLR